MKYPSDYRHFFLLVVSGCLTDLLGKHLVKRLLLFLIEFYSEDLTAELDEIHSIKPQTPLTWDASISA